VRSTDILVVDDEMGIRELLSEILQDEGYTVALAENAREARELRNQARPALVLLDIWMPDTDGVTLLKEWARTGQLSMPVVMMSGHATIDTAVEATRIGAFDFLEKPITLQKLLTTVSKALKHGESTPRREVALARLGKSAAVGELNAALDQVLNIKSPVLLAGEPGVGFEACARYLHQAGSPFVIPTSNEDVADSYGDLLSRASQGVLFLPEIGFYNRKAQAGLSQLLSRLDKFNCRLVCATSRPLNSYLSGVDFDPALFNALSAVVVPIPPLRQHQDDIPDLATHMLEQIIDQHKVSAKRISTAALNGLRQHEWPGNLEQLNNVVRSLVMTCTATEIDSAQVNKVLAQFGGGEAPKKDGNAFNFDLPLRELRDLVERQYFEYHIGLEKGNMSRVAEKVGLERTHLYRKLKQLGVAVTRRVD
jgi:two-component system nitrogen regulation response regulator NtrX